MARFPLRAAYLPPGRRSEALEGNPGKRTPGMRLSEEGRRWICLHEGGPAHIVKAVDIVEMAGHVRRR